MHAHLKLRLKAGRMHPYVGGERGEAGDECLGGKKDKGEMSEGERQTRYRGAVADLQQPTGGARMFVCLFV